MVGLQGFGCLEALKNKAFSVALKAICSWIVDAHRLEKSENTGRKGVFGA